MLTDLEKKLVVALRSGDYSQCAGRLQNSYGHCCLGVACDVFDSSRWLKREVYWYYLDPNNRKNGAYLPRDVANELNWKYLDGRVCFTAKGTDYLFSLTDANDAAFTFDQIADMIQAELVIRIGEDDSNYV